MNKFIPLLLILFISCKHKTPLAKDTTTLQVPKEENDDPEVPEYKVMHIQHTLDSVSQHYTCGEKWGDVTYYYDHKSLCLIVLSSSTDDQDVRNEQFYIQNGELFLYYLRYCDWNFKSDKPRTQNWNTELRKYFANGKAVKCLQRRYTDTTQSPALNDCQVENTINLYKTLLKNERHPTSGCLTMYTPD